MDIVLKTAAAVASSPTHLLCDASYFKNLPSTFAVPVSISPASPISPIPPPPCPSPHPLVNADGSVFLM